MRSKKFNKKKGKRGRCLRGVILYNVIVPFTYMGWSCNGDDLTQSAPQMKFYKRGRVLLWACGLEFAANKGCLKRIILYTRLRTASRQMHVLYRSDRVKSTAVLVLYLAPQAYLLTKYLVHVYIYYIHACWLIFKLYIPRAKTADIYPRGEAFGRSRCHGGSSWSMHIVVGSLLVVMAAFPFTTAAPF